MTSATVLFQKPTPSQAMKMPMSAMLGSARPTEDAPRARAAPVPVA
jgi:hypothetical protein